MMSEAKRKIIEEMAEGVLKAVGETYQSSRKAGLSHIESSAKASIRLKARCEFLLNRHPEHVVTAAMDIVIKALEGEKK